MTSPLAAYNNAENPAGGGGATTACIHVGDRRVIVGMKGRFDLIGRVCVVVAHSREPGRWKVRLLGESASTGTMHAKDGCLVTEESWTREEEEKKRVREEEEEKVRAREAEEEKVRAREEEERKKEEKEEEEIQERRRAYLEDKRLNPEKYRRAASGWRRSSSYCCDSRTCTKARVHLHWQHQLPHLLGSVRVSGCKRSHSYCCDSCTCTNARSSVRTDRST